MKVNANEKPWNAIILVIYMKNWHEKPWKVTNFQTKNPNFHLCIFMYYEYTHTYWHRYDEYQYQYYTYNIINDDNCEWRIVTGNLQLYELCYKLARKHMF
jgi:hypothetical protein